MKIVDRYLLRQFIGVYGICFFSLAGLYIVFDAFGHLDEFLQYGEKRGNLLEIIGRYYAFRSVYFFDRASGVLALIAAMFTTAWLERHNELTALLAAGVSKVRIIAPTIAAAAGISLVAATSREALIPMLRADLVRSPKDLLGNVPKAMRPRYDNRTDILMRGKSTLAADRRIREPDFRLPPRLHDRARQIIAENAYYHDAQPDWPAGYLLDDVKEPQQLLTQPSILLGQSPVVITPHDAPTRLGPNQCYVVSDLNFEQLAAGPGWRQLSSTMDLIRGLRNPSLDFGADVRVTIHARVVRPMLDMTLLFLGLPLVLTRQNKSIFVAVGTCLVVVCLFLIVVMGLHHLGAIYLLDPALSAWLPLIIFAPVAVALSESLRQ